MDLKTVDRDADGASDENGMMLRGEPQQWPLVSIVVPCFNEERFISRVLESLVKQDYPEGNFEILFVDGRSTDRTREQIAVWREYDSRIRLVDNPERNKPAALNRGIGVAQGDVVVRIDAHAEYPSDYVRLCVQNLLCTAADNVGGLRETRSRDNTPFGRAIALSISSRFGSGGATYRTGAAGRRWVDTVFCGTYRRELFEKIGLFDERLLRGQDREFNERLRIAGGRVLFVPEIRSVYFARSRLGPFVRWIYEGGMTPFRISRIVGYRVWSMRNLFPPVFAGVILGFPLLSLAFPVLWVAWFSAVASYLLVGLAFSIYEAARIGESTLFIRLWVVFFLTHVVYGLGAIHGMVLPLEPENR